MVAETEGYSINRRLMLAIAGSATAALHTASAPAAPLPRPDEIDFLQLFLQMSYLKGQFYSQAATGQYLAPALVSGTGVAGTTTGGRAIAFADPLIRQAATEFLEIERAQITALRGAIGAGAVGQPAIDIRGGAGTPFASFFQAVIGTSAAAFDPYAGDDNFLLGSILFELAISLLSVGGGRYARDAFTYDTLLESLTYDPFLPALASLMTVDGRRAALLMVLVRERSVANPAVLSQCQLVTRRLISRYEWATGYPIGPSNGRLEVTRPMSGYYYAPETLQRLGGFFPSDLNGFITKARGQGEVGLG